MCIRDRVRALDAKSDLVGALEGEISDLEAKRKELFPLSAIVQTMRKTQQTSLYLERLGPFFVGRAVWQSPL